MPAGAHLEGVGWPRWPIWGATGAAKLSSELAVRTPSPAAILRASGGAHGRRASEALSRSYTARRRRLECGLRTDRVRGLRDQPRRPGSGPGMWSTDPHACGFARRAGAPRRANGSVPPICRSIRARFGVLECELVRMEDATGMAVEWSGLVGDTVWGSLPIFTRF